nr:O-sialoglycoprotein endopeptidase [Natroniella sulfidigena]
MIAQKRERLEVKQGERGLRQSEAVFQHVKKLPDVIAEIAEDRKGELTKIVVSTSPTSQPNSYMPVFRVGEGQAKSLASILGLPLVETTHQEGHLMAGVWSTGLETEEFLAIHLSGGTSELLKVSKKQELGFEVEVLGTSQDLHAGQFIDRVGVELGLPFPAGPCLEELATEGELGEIIIPSAVDGYQMSFSGPTSAAMRAIEAGEKKADIALAVQQAIANTVEKVVRKAVVEEKLTEILIVGGVAANQYIRARLRKRLEHPRIGAKLYFADPEWSSDNAVGTAALALE